MNPITQALVDNLIVVYFVYGLAFFVLGIALALAARQGSDLAFVDAIRPLAGFGFVHGVHEWLEMFQLIGRATDDAEAGLGLGVLRLFLLVSSFAMLLSFAGRLWAAYAGDASLEARVVGIPLGLWGIAVLWLAMQDGPLAQGLDEADVLARYLLAIPGALLGSWMLMLQQREFRAADMAQFGGGLVWCASALFLYGVFGQTFVTPTSLPPSHLLNSVRFLEWFGIPVQIFRATMAVVLTLAMLRVLRAFEVEQLRRLQLAHANEVAAREHALEVERRARSEETRLNLALQARAQELALLLDLSNTLTTAGELRERLEQALRQVVRNLPFADAGMILLAEGGRALPDVAAVTGYVVRDPDAGTRYGSSVMLGRMAYARKQAVCLHEDGTVLEFGWDFGREGSLFGTECRQYTSPTTMIALPLIGHAEPEGAIVLARSKLSAQMLSFDDLRLLAAVAQQLGQSIEAARLYRDAQSRERLLGDLLHQIVDAQEAERRRIARELHDATAQSLTAIALGLRGMEATLAERGMEEPSQLRTINAFVGNALVELRRIMADLRPPQLDDLGLLPALHWYVQEFRKRYAETNVALETSGDLPRLAPEVETLVFRIVQEALTNVGKHAAATAVRVALAVDEGMLTICVEDNGRGFDPAQAMQTAAPGWGLLGMRERTQLLGGGFELHSQPGRGTTVRVWVPLRRATHTAEETNRASANEQTPAATAAEQAVGPPVDEVER